MPSARTFRFMGALLLSAALLAPGGQGFAAKKNKPWKKNKKSIQPASPKTNSGQPESTSPTSSVNAVNPGSGVNAPSATAAPSAPVDPALQTRIKNLIAVVEIQPEGLVISNRGKVEAPPDHQTYTADGSRNENFVVTPDYSQAEGILAINHDQRRVQAVQELIKIGRPAVEELAVALAADHNHYRHYYCYALGVIGDPRAVPAILKYFEDGRMKLRTAPATRSLGNENLARELEEEGRRMIAESVLSLQKITGESYGPDGAKWSAWWEANKADVGPTPNLIRYTANPPAPKVHYDPGMFKMTTPTIVNPWEQQP